MGATKARQLRRAQELAAKQGLPPPASLAELTTAPSAAAAAATAEAAATAAPTAAGEVRQKKRKHKDVQVDGSATVPAGGASTASGTFSTASGTFSTASGTFSTASGTFSGSLSKKDRSDTLKAQDLQDLKAQSWKKPSAGHGSASQVQMGQIGPCNLCGAMGHLGRTCPSRVCRLCGGVGHIAKHCTRQCATECSHCGSTAHTASACTFGALAEERYLYCRPRAAEGPNIQVGNGDGGSTPSSSSYPPPTPPLPPLAPSRCFSRHFILPMRLARTDFETRSLRQGRMDVACSCVSAMLFRSQVKSLTPISLPHVRAHSPYTSPDAFSKSWGSHITGSRTHDPLSPGSNLVPLYRMLKQIMVSPFKCSSARRVSVGTRWSRCASRRRINASRSRARRYEASSQASLAFPFSSPLCDSQLFHL